MVAEEDVRGADRRLPGLPGGRRQQQPGAQRGLQPGPDLPAAVAVPGIRVDGRHDAVFVVRQFGEGPAHGVEGCAEHGIPAPGGGDQQEFPAGPDSEGGAVFRAKGGGGFDLVRAGVSDDVGVRGGLGAVAAEAGVLLLVREDDGGRDDLTVVQQPLGGQAERPGLGPSPDSGFRIPDSGFRILAESFIVSGAVRCADERGPDVLQIPAAAGAHREVEFPGQDLLPRNEEKSVRGGEFRDAAVERRRPRAAEHDPHARVTLEDGEHVEQPRRRGDVVDDAQDRALGPHGEPPPVRQQSSSRPHPDTHFPDPPAPRSAYG